MEMEVERADCRDMVRDITHAVLPTRASMQHGLGAVSLGRPAAIGEEEEQRLQVPHRVRMCTRNRDSARGGQPSSVSAQDHRSMPTGGAGQRG